MNSKKSSNCLLIQKSSYVFSFYKIHVSFVFVIIEKKHIENFDQHVQIKHLSNTGFR